MKTATLPVRSKKGFTLLEMTIVIMVLLALAKMSMFGFSKVDQWRLGRAASETLRTVYSAQRMYLADNPMTRVTDLTEAMIIPYLPNRSTAAVPGTLVAAFQTVRPLSGGALGFNVAVSPPRFTQANTWYDPSAPPGANPDAIPKDPGFTDSLWDVGE